MILPKGEITPTNAWLAFEPNKETAWTQRHANHLWRRAGFGADSATLKRATDAGLSSTLENLISPTGIDDFDQQMSRAAMLVGAGDETRRVVTWWLYRMRHSPDPLGEQWPYSGTTISQPAPTRFRMQNYCCGRTNCFVKKVAAPLVNCCRRWLAIPRC